MGKEKGVFLFFSLPLSIPLPKGIGGIVFLGKTYEKVAEWFLYPTNNADWIPARFPSPFWPPSAAGAGSSSRRERCSVPAHCHGSTDGSSGATPAPQGARSPLQREFPGDSRAPLSRAVPEPGWAERGQCRGHTDTHSAAFIAFISGAQMTQQRP